MILHRRRGVLSDLNLEKRRSNIREIFTEFLAYSNLSLTALFSQFFDSRGYSPTQIGILMAISPTFSLLANPFWFSLSRKRSAPGILRLMTFVAAMIVWGVYLSSNFVLAFASVSAVAFFIASLIPITESIVVPSLRIKGRRFDRVRLFGTVGYASTALLSSFLIEIDFSSIFILSSVALLLLGFISGGYSSRSAAERNERTGTGRLPGTFVVMLAVGVTSITIGAFGSTFFPVLTRELGFDLSAAGMGYSLMAFSEVPFLFFADRFLDKFGNFKILLLGLFLTGLRWFLTSLVDSFPLFMALQSLHGLNYVIVYYSVFNYIHFKLPGDVALKAQAIYWMSTMGISYFLGSVVGGLLVDAFGLKTVYLSLGVAGMLLSVVFTVVLIYTGKRFRPIS